MRSLYTYSFLALTFAAVASAQIVLDPSPARVAGHPSTPPAEQLVVTNINPDLGVNGGMYFPEGVAVDTTGSTPILYVADTLNNRILAWKNATSATLSNLQPPALIIGQPNAFTTLPATNGGLYFPSGLVVDAKGNLYVADAGNNRVLRYPAPFASNNAGPDIVLGQPDKFAANKANQGGAISAQTLCLSGSCPAGYGNYFSALALDSSGDLFVADAGNRRVLEYPAASLTSGAADPAASVVIGQAGFTLTNGPTGVTDRNTLYQPAGLAFDSAGHLFVTDTYASRLLVFTPPFSNDMAASRLAAIVNPAPSTATASTLLGPNGLVMINNGPAVLDSGNNRLLIFDAYSSADWTVASGDSTASTPPPVAIAAIGQGSSLTNFSSTKPNAGNPQASFSNSGAQLATFSNPVAAAVAGTDLFVADAGNNRVLVYPNAGQAAAAAVVLGQSGFPYNSPNSIQGGEFNFSSSSGYDAGIAVDSSSGTPHLYVSDPGNNRVLGFADARKVGPGVQADLVIGEPDLRTAVCNYNGAANPPSEPLARQPTAATLCYPTGLAVDPGTGNLFVADTYNGRVLRFPAPFAAPTSMESADLVLGQTGFTGVSNTQASASVMLSPYGLLFDPQRGLLVSDPLANRVLLFPMISPLSGEQASAVFGQANFSGTTDYVLNSPRHIAEDSVGRLYVADWGNGRIAIYDISSPSDAPGPNAYTGLSSPEAVWVNPNPASGDPSYANDIWVGDANGLWRYPYYQPQAFNSTPLLEEPAAEVIPGPVFCPTAPNRPYCSAAAALAITQDSFGDLYVADASNRVGIHYPALAGSNAANWSCAMACTTGGLAEATVGASPGAFVSLIPFGPLSFPVSATPVSNGAYPTPTTLGGVQVLVNGQPSPISFVARGQINFIVPIEAPTSGAAQVTVVDASTSQVLGSGSSGIAADRSLLGLRMAPASPGFFTTSANGEGQVLAENCNQTPCENTPNSESNPVNPGKYIQFYLTGQGVWPNFPLVDGQAALGAENTPSKPVVYIGSSPAPLQYSGLAPGLPGVWQINVQIPNGLQNFPNFTPGLFPVLVSYENLASNTGANNSNPSVAATIWINAPE